MNQIRSSDAFGLSLIRQYPNPDAPEVKEIIRKLEPAAKKMARRVLRKAKSQVAKTAVR